MSSVPSVASSLGRLVKDLARRTLATAGPVAAAMVVLALTVIVWAQVARHDGCTRAPTGLTGRGRPDDPGQVGSCFQFDARGVRSGDDEGDAPPPDLEIRLSTLDLATPADLAPGLHDGGDADCEERTDDEDVPPMERPACWWTDALDPGGLTFRPTDPDDSSAFGFPTDAPAFIATFEARWLASAREVDAYVGEHGTPLEDPLDVELAYCVPPADSHGRAGNSDAGACGPFERGHSVPPEAAEGCPASPVVVEGGFTSAISLEPGRTVRFELCVLVEAWSDVDRSALAAWEAGGRSGRLETAEGRPHLLRLDVGGRESAYFSVDHVTTAGAQRSTKSSP